MCKLLLLNDFGCAFAYDCIALEKSNNREFTCLKHPTLGFIINHS